MEKDIKIFIINRIDQRLKLFGIKPAEITDKFDLVQSGLLDSMAFVEVIAGLEQHLKKEIDFEKAFENLDFTTIKGIIKVFNSI